MQQMEEESLTIYLAPKLVIFIGFMLPKLYSEEFCALMLVFHLFLYVMVLSVFWHNIFCLPHSFVIIIILLVAIQINDWLNVQQQIFHAYPGGEYIYILLSHYEWNLHCTRTMFKSASHWKQQSTWRHDTLFWLWTDQS